MGTGSRHKGESSGRVSRKALSEGQERLLMRFYDDELGVVGRWYARRLIDGSLAAYEFVEELKRCRVTSDISTSVDLWSAIDEGIAGQLGLGARQRASEPLPSAASSWSRSSWAERLGWACGGTALGATGSFVFMLFGALQGSPGMVPVASSGGQGAALQEVALSSGAGRTRRVPVPLENRDPSIMEVDWMRSSGRVKVLQDPSGDSPIIWVKRRDPLASNFSISARPRIVKRSSQAFQVPE